MFIKDIFQKEYNAEEVHNEFIKFSRGDFKDKFLLNAKKQKDKWVIKTGAEYVNSVVKLCLAKAPDTLKVTGVIVATFDITKDAKFQIGKIKQFMGIKQAVVDGVIKKSDILELMNKYPRAFYALSFITPSCELKIKAKAPKSAKPSTSDKEAVADFCSLKTTDRIIVEDLFFDNSNFTEIAIKHILKIQEIIYPKDMKNMKPEDVREKSKRKGVLVREITADGSKKISEAVFEA